MTNKTKAIRYTLIFGLSAAFVMIFKTFFGSWLNTLILIGVLWAGLAITCIGEPENATNSPYNYPAAPRKWRVLFTIAAFLSGLLFFITIEALRDANWLAFAIHTLLWLLDAATFRICLDKAKKYKAEE